MSFPLCYRLCYIPYCCVNNSFDCPQVRAVLSFLKQVAHTCSFALHISYMPPGTGKTLVARALAATASKAGTKVSFFMRKGADVLSKWVGEAERQLRLLFEEAQKAQPSIIFFDEIDGLAPVSHCSGFFALTVQLDVLDTVIKEVCFCMEIVIF